MKPVGCQEQRDADERERGAPPKAAGGGRPAALSAGAEMRFPLLLPGTQPLPRSASPAFSPFHQQTAKRPGRFRGERKRWDNQLGKYLLLRRESCQKQSPARQRYLCRQLPSLPAGSERLHVQHEPKRGERDRAQGCQRVCVFPYSRSLLCSF